jgi:hypothetical protein
MLCIPVSAIWLVPRLLIDLFEKILRCLLLLRYREDGSAHAQVGVLGMGARSVSCPPPNSYRQDSDVLGVLTGVTDVR